WQMPLANGAELRKTTDDASFDYSPHASSNGKWLAFGRLRSPGSSIWVKDLSTGKEAGLILSEKLEVNPLISDDGKTVVFEERDKEAPSLWVAEAGKSPRRICDDCGGPMAWASSTAVFYQAQAPSRLMAVDLRTGRTSVVLERAPYSLGDPS